MINVGIIGGAGYTAGELVRILLNHPESKIQFIHSSSNYGKNIADVHTDLLGDTDLFFSDFDFKKVNIVFLCMGHGKSKEFVQNNKIPGNVKIIDLSHDYRLKHDENVFVYGLPELNREKIKKADYIANPGCFATGIELTLLPLAAKNLLIDDIHVNGITGSTGAGQNPSGTTHFSWRNNNISIYKAFTHQHLGEIIQSIKQLQSGFKNDVNFIPVRGNFTRGILISAYTNCDLSEPDLNELYKEYYQSHPFVTVSEKDIDLKQVVNTNKCLLNIKKHNNKVLIQSVTDNLIKGASGQAVQNMNLMFGLPETTGLNLKPVAF
ncbi:MAG: N-acetyl-gamma-glutamyl-phosphate reductase [Bacteroidales bacterium]|nr:N-acetyl-gamma-glutamyl-phosphate reductase [Bacteroidales bacterium]